MIRTSDADWEQQVRDAVAAGVPFRVACHPDPLPGILRARPHMPRRGSHTPKWLRGPLREALGNARAEGYTWRSLAHMLGVRGISQVRYHAGALNTSRALDDDTAAS